MKSKKALFKYLNDKYAGGWPIYRLDNDNISDETYGKDSRIYFWGVKRLFKVTRKQFETDLKGEGFRVHSDYHPGSDYSEVSVSYFKGWHWNE